MLIIIGCLVGVIIGAGAICAVLLPKVKQTQKLDLELAKQNEDAKKSLEYYLDKVDFNKNQLATIQKELTVNIDHNNQILDFMKEQQAHASTVAEEYLDAAMQSAQIAADNYQAKMDAAKEEYQNDYLAAMQEAVVNFQEEIETKKQAIDLLQKQLAVESATVLAAVEANKRAAEMEEKEDFYRLVLSQEDKNEIAELRDCLNHFRNPEPLNKIIYKVYYEKPYTDLIGRVVGSGVHCGIYKITNLQNGMCYVGQAVNIADRWKQHIKRGMGADTPTRNKLYPAMLAIGVENFSFEIIEECDRSQLNDKEDYWQDFFRAKEFGYSIK